MERKGQGVNNAYYDTLEEKWYQACDHPIALLRAENALRVPWIIEKIRSRVQQKCKFLDIGCGAGFLCNPMAAVGHEVVGIDLSPSSLNEAQKRDATKKVQYVVGAAEELPFPDKSFDVVSALDLLEHVENPAKVIAEASRVLRPGGLFFFHTFNRNFLSWLLVIKAVEWCVPNTPPRNHVYGFFITPDELQEMCSKNDLNVAEMLGMRPVFLSQGFWKSIFSRKVASDFLFTFTESLKTGFLGFAVKTNVF